METAATVHNTRATPRFALIWLPNRPRSWGFATVLTFPPAIILTFSISLVQVIIINLNFNLTKKTT